MPARPFTLGPWLVDPAAHEVRRDGAAVRLEPKAVAVLVHLAAHAGEVVTREALLGAVWPDVVVTDASLTRCVSQLRQALGDDARRLIETVPTVGYRLLAAPEPVAPEPSPPEPSSSAPPPPASSPTRASRPGALPRWARWALALVALALVAWAALALRPDPAAVATYRIDVAGAVADAVVTYTAADGTTGTDRPASFPYVRTVEARAGTYRLRLRGRASGAEVRLSVAVRRGDDDWARHETVSTVEGGPFDLFALAQAAE